MNLPLRLSKFSPYVLAGGGDSMIFHPTGNIGTFVLVVGTQAKGTFLYGGGADYALTTHFSLRVEYRGFVYKDSDFGVAA
jgi:opacity protein-like surface antigen